MAKKMEPQKKKVTIQKPAAKKATAKKSAAKKSTTMKTAVKKYTPKKSMTKKVAPVSLEQQLTQRESELAILNSVGEAMAQTLDVKTVTKIVGDKVRDIFHAEVTEILLLDTKSDLIHVPYAFARDYQEVEPFALGEGLTSKVILSREPLVYSTGEQADEMGALTPTEEDKTESLHGCADHRWRKGLGCGQRAKLPAERLQRKSRAPAANAFLQHGRRH